MSDRKLTGIFMIFTVVTVILSLSQIPKRVESQSVECNFEEVSSTYSIYKEETLITGYSTSTNTEISSEQKSVAEEKSNNTESNPVQENKAVGVLRRSNLTAEELATGLFDELPKYAETFIEAEQVTGVNAVFLASIAAQESGWGTSPIARNKNNLFGWTDDYGYYMHFESVEACILYVADCIRFNYLEPEGEWFEGYEVADVCVHYNGNPSWETAVSNIMGEIIERIERSNSDELE